MPDNENIELTAICFGRGNALKVLMVGQEGVTSIEGPQRTGLIQKEGSVRCSAVPCMVANHEDGTILLIPVNEVVWMGAFSEAATKEALDAAQQVQEQMEEQGEFDFMGADPGHCGMGVVENPNGLKVVYPDNNDEEKTDGG